MFLEISELHHLVFYLKKKKKIKRLILKEADRSIVVVLL